MAANTLASFTKSPVPTPSLYFAASAFTHFSLNSLSCFSLRQKSANNGLLICCRCGALAINGHQPTSTSTDPGIMLFPLFQEIGLNAKEIKAILDTNSALRSTPFESIHSRIRLLQCAGLNGRALSRLIARRPDVLTAEEIDALLSFIVYDDNLELRGKIKLSRIQRVLNTTEPGLLVGFERKVKLLHQFGISKEKLVHVLNTVSLNKALCLKSYEEIDRMLVFLQRFGGAELIIRRPTILNYDLDTQLIPRIRFLLELSGDDEKSIETLLLRLPHILAYRVDHLKDHVEFWSSYAGLSYNEILRIVLIYPVLFGVSIKRKLRPRVNFLKECGLTSHELYRFLIKAPGFLGLSFEENLVHKLVFLVKIGYQSRTKELAVVMGAVTRCSCKHLQQVIGVFLNYGLACEDIFYMCKKHPQVLQYNHKSVEEKLDYLIEEMGREVGELLAFPAYLGYKLDSRIKYRYEVGQKVFGKGMSINALLTMSEEKFSTKCKKKSSMEMSLDRNEIERK